MAIMCKCGHNTHRIWIPSPYLPFSKNISTTPISIITGWWFYAHSNLIPNTTFNILPVIYHMRSIHPSSLTSVQRPTHPSAPITVVVRYAQSEWMNASLVTWVIWWLVLSVSVCGGAVVSFVYCLTMSCHYFMPHDKIINRFVNIKSIFRKNGRHTYSLPASQSACCCCFCRFQVA